MLHSTASACISSLYLVLILGLVSLSLASVVPIARDSSADPCAAVAGQKFVVPAEARACLKSFPFNETLRQNVLAVISRVFDFYTFENYYLNSPPPFQDSTSNIRTELARINSTEYATDYDFNKAVYDFISRLNDGHTFWLPYCYIVYQNLLPAPVNILEENGEQNVFITPDSAEFINSLGENYTGYYDSINFDWRRLAGAKVLEIEGMDPFDYIDFIADTVSGWYLDHGVRVNKVVSSYRLQYSDYSQRMGDLAGPWWPTLDNLTFNLIVVNGTDPENVTVPYLAGFGGTSFTDQTSYWESNCAANKYTNGVDKKKEGSAPTNAVRRDGRLLGKAVTTKGTHAFRLPDQYHPNLSQVNGSTGEIKSYILADGQTGVMFLQSFGGNFTQFQVDTDSAMKSFVSAGVSRLLIDLTNTGGGETCLGSFLHRYLAGSQAGYGGYQFSLRANELAQKIVANDIALNLTDSFYYPTNWAFLNDTVMPSTYNYMDPPEPFVVNGVSDPTSQRFHDPCLKVYQIEVPESPLIPLENIAIVSNGNCPSTCAQFATLMNERHNTTIAVFGGKPGEQMEFKGMAGEGVVEWSELDTEIKTANLKNDPLAPPDLLIDGDFRHNWMTAWSYFDENKPIAYVSELPKFRFAYTKDTYNNPQNLWTFAASQIFG